MIGFGSPGYQLAFCIANRPPIDHYPQQNTLEPLAPGEIAHIVSNTSNHWRKLFNVYAKVLEALGWTQDWRQYRDEQLLQLGCPAALLFDRPAVDEPRDGQSDHTIEKRIHIVAGKGHAQDLGLKVEWLDAHFAINRQQRLIVSPYLDYRQLSNERIERLAVLVKSLSQ